MTGCLHAALHVSSSLAQSWVQCCAEVRCFVRVFWAHKTAIAPHTLCFVGHLVVVCIPAAGMTRSPHLVWGRGLPLLHSLRAHTCVGSMRQWAAWWVLLLLRCVLVLMFCWSCSGVLSVLWCCGVLYVHPPWSRLVHCQVCWLGFTTVQAGGRQVVFF